MLAAGVLRSNCLKKTGNRAHTLKTDAVIATSAQSPPAHFGMRFHPTAKAGNGSIPVATYRRLEWHVGQTEDLLDNAVAQFRAPLGQRRARIHHHAVREHGQHQTLDVVGDDIVAAFHRASDWAARNRACAPRGLTPSASDSWARVFSTIASM